METSNSSSMDSSSRNGATSPFPIIINSQTLSKEGLTGCDQCCQLSQAIRQAFHDQTNRLSNQINTATATCCQKTNKVNLQLHGYKQKVKWYYECSYCEYKSFYTSEIETHITSLHPQASSQSDHRFQPINDLEVTVEEVLPPDRLNLSLSDLDTPKPNRGHKQYGSSSKPNGKSLSMSQEGENQPQSIVSKKQRKSKHKFVKVIPEDEAAMEQSAPGASSGADLGAKSQQPHKLAEAIKAPVTSTIRSPNAHKYVLVVPGTNPGMSSRVVDVPAVTTVPGATDQTQRTQTTSTLANTLVGIPAVPTARQTVIYGPSTGQPVFGALITDKGALAAATVNMSLAAPGQQMTTGTVAGRNVISIRQLIDSVNNNGQTASQVSGLPAVMSTSSDQSTATIKNQGLANKAHTVPPLHIYPPTTSVTADGPPTTSVTADGGISASPTFSPPHKRVDIDQFSNILGLKKVDDSSVHTKPTDAQLNFESIASGVLTGLQNRMSVAARKSTSRNHPPIRPPKKADILLSIIKNSVKAEFAKNPGTKPPIDFDAFAKDIHYRYTTRAIRKSSSRNAPPSQGELSYIIKSTYQYLLTKKQEAARMSREFAEVHPVLTSDDLTWLNERESDYRKIMEQSSSVNVSAYDEKMAELVTSKWGQHYQPTASSVKTMRDKITLAMRCDKPNVDTMKILSFLSEETCAAEVDKIVAKYLLLTLYKNRKQGANNAPNAKDMFVWRQVGMKASLAQKSIASADDSKWKPVVPGPKAKTNSSSPLTLTTSGTLGTYATTESITTATMPKESPTQSSQQAASKPSVVKIGPIPRTTTTNDTVPAKASSSPDIIQIPNPKQGADRPIWNPVKRISSYSKTQTADKASTPTTVDSVANNNPSISSILQNTKPNVTPIVPTSKIIMSATNKDVRSHSAEPHTQRSTSSLSDTIPRPSSAADSSSVVTGGADSNTIVRKGTMTLNLGDSKATLGSVSKFDLTRLKELPKDLQELQTIITKTITKPKITIHRSKLIQNMTVESVINWKLAMAESGMEIPVRFKRKQTARKSTAPRWGHKSDKTSMLKSAFSLTKPADKKPGDAASSSTWSAASGSALCLPIPSSSVDQELPNQTLAGTSWHKTHLMQSKSGDNSLGTSSQYLSNIEGGDSEENVPPGRVLRNLATRACAAAQQKQQIILSSKPLSPLTISTEPAPKLVKRPVGRPRKESTASMMVIEGGSSPGPYQTTEEQEENPWPSPKTASPTPPTPLVTEQEPVIMKPPAEPVRRRSVTPLDPPLLTIGKRSLTPSSRSSSPSISLAKNSPRLSNTANRVNKDTAQHALTALCLPAVSQANPDQSPNRKKELVMSACYMTEVNVKQHGAKYHHDSISDLIDHDIKHKAKLIKPQPVNLYSQDEADMEDDCVWPGPSLSDEESQENNKTVESVTAPPTGRDNAEESEGEISDSESMGNYLHPHWACLTGCRFHSPYKGKVRSRSPGTPASTDTESIQSSVSRPKRARTSSVASSVEGTSASGGKKKAKVTVISTAVIDISDSSNKQTVKGGDVMSTSTPARMTRKSGAEYEFSSGEELSSNALPGMATGTGGLAAGPGGIPTLVVRPRRQSPQTAATSQQKT